MSAASPSTSTYRVGYARVSTNEQNLDLQVDALKACGCGRIYEEKVSSSKAERVQLAECIRNLRPGDTLTVWRLDRLGRSLSELIKIITDLQARGVIFESLTERLDTVSATGKLMFHVFGALAEFERNTIRERTMAGLAAARARGRRGGRKKITTPKMIREMRALYDSKEVVVMDICNRYGISKSTFYLNVLGRDYAKPKGEEEK